MSAKEMFEKLGYKYTKYGDDIQYCKQFTYAGIRIYFSNFREEIEISSDKNIIITIDKNELQAMNKQAEELGWNK